MSKDQQKVYEILKDARDLLAKGWVQGVIWATDVDGTECYCATGAIREASLVAKHYYHRRKHYIKAIARVLGTEIKWSEGQDWTDKIFELQSWNDDPERTKGEVLKAFDEAIENLEKELIND